jgi:GH24 family phage-related lysozyme (muramidase)
VPKLPAGTAKLVAVPAFVIAAIIASLQVNEGRKLVPYWDALGKVWTVCAGVTGPEVIPGRTYTDAECDTMEARYVQRMLANMGGCVTVPLAFHEIRAWGDFAYNVGTKNFCNSTAARLLNAGENTKACRQIPRWRYAGGVDCSTKGNTVCPGIWTRRLWEQSLCLGDS